MQRLTRRDFMKGTLAAAATITIAGTKSSGRVLGANDVIRVGCAGLNGRGSAHVGAYFPMKDVQITYLIDPDSRTYGKHLGRWKDQGTKPQTVADVRKALEDKNLDAISIATPNHWHALMTIWACQAGKDVYVEKPCSHNVHEGRIAVETARKYKRIVQHGTQSRGSTGWQQIQELAKSGKLGKELVSRGLCYKTRNSIGVKEATEAPKDVDFNIWLGPAAERPFHGNLVHYNWHWFWDFGNGDIGNQGVHEMDKARWVIPGATLPKSVIALGGRFGYTDQGETPNTQIALMDYGTTKLIFEVRGLKTSSYYGQGVGNTVHFEAGVVVGDKLYPKGDQTKAEALPKVEVPRRGEQFANFVACMRSRKVEDLNADILEGHYSSALCHLANVSYRMGRQASFAEVDKEVSDADLAETLGRMKTHLKDNNVDLDKIPCRLGKKLMIDPSAENFTNDAEANKLLTRQYRKGFEVPDKVV